MMRRLFAAAAAFSLTVTLILPSNATAAVLDTCKETVVTKAIDTGGRGVVLGANSTPIPECPPDPPPNGASLPDGCGATALDDAASRSLFPQLWEGHQIGDGHVYRKYCNDGGLLNPAPFFLTNDVAPPPDPAILAQQAIDSIEFPTPEPHLGPETLLAVNRWIYLTVDDPGTLTAQAAVPGLAITATATLTTTTWSMGEITDIGQRSTVAPFTCTGAGRAPSATANLRASQPQEPGTCAYAYQFRSLRERTNGTGTWPVTATTTWSITWTATDGTTGTATRTQTSDPYPASVGEWASELVAGPS